MRVKAGKSYQFNPVLIDVCDPKTSLKSGDIVTVVKLHGCPPPNTMNHCHVNYQGRFAGLVHCNSLTEVK